MHNSHFIISTGTDIEEVENNITAELDSWGDENNWYNIRRTINVSEATEEDKEYIQEVLNDFNETFSEDNFNKLKQNIKDEEEKLKQDNQRFHYYTMGKLNEKLYEISPHKGKKYTINDLNDIIDYFGYTFDEWGITNIYYDEGEDSRLFFTEIDMHS